MKRSFVLAVCTATALGCDRTLSRAESTTSTAAPTAALAAQNDTAYSAEWNMGDDPDYPDKSVDTRFRVRVTRFRSGTLRIWLDTSKAGVSETHRAFYPADSVQATALAPIDRFTQGCGYGSGPWKPRVGVVSDTTYEHHTKPRLIWFLDTATARIRQLPTDSATCFVAGPD
jgi:hypothetical protein